MRTIKNWNSDEIREFNNLVKRGLDAFGVIGLISHDSSMGSALYVKRTHASDEEKNQFAQDIIDLLTGRAEFCEPKYLFKLRGINGDFSRSLYLTRIFDSDKSILDTWSFSDNELLDNPAVLYTQSEAEQALGDTTLTLADFDIIEANKDE